MSRLSLLLFVVPFVALAASGCGSHKSARQDESDAVVSVQATDPSATDTELNQGAKLLVDRLTWLGVPSGQIQVRPEDHSVSVEFPRNLVSATSFPILTRRTRLQVYDLENDLAATSKTAEPQTSLYSLLAPHQQDVEFKGADGWELFNSSTKKLVAGPVKTPEALFRARVARLRHVRPGKPPYVVFGVPKKLVAVSCGTNAIVCPPGVAQPTKRTWYLFNHEPALTVSDVTSARSEVDPAQGSVVVVGLDRAGARRLRDATRTLYQRGQLEQRPQHLAVVVDGQIRSMPQIDFTDTTLANGISGNSLQVGVLRSPTLAKQLALALEPLPVQFARIR